MVGGPYPVDEIEDNPHRNAEFLKVEIPIVVHVGEIPYPLQLVIAQLAVLQYRGRLRAGEVGAAVGERGEDLPVALDFPLFDLLGGHGLMDWKNRGTEGLGLCERENVGASSVERDYHVYLRWSVGLRVSPFFFVQSRCVFGRMVGFYSRVPAHMIECPPRTYRRDALKAALNLFKCLNSTILSRRSTRSMALPVPPIQPSFRHVPRSLTGKQPTKLLEHPQVSQKRFLNPS